MSFTKPAADGRIDEKKERYVSFSTSEDSKVVAPYNGYVTDIKKNNNDTEIIIKHEIDNKTIYSGIGGIKTVKTHTGERVYKGDIIGFSSRVIYLRFYDSSFTIIKNPFKIFDSGSVSDTNVSDSKDSKEDSKKKEKVEVPKLSTNSKKDRPALYQGFLKAITAPLWIAGAALKGDKEKEKKEKLDEEIQKIKTLIK